jgi:hypothetical protein
MRRSTALFLSLGILLLAAACSETPTSSISEKELLAKRLPLVKLLNKAGLPIDNEGWTTTSQGVDSEYLYDSSLGVISYWHPKYTLVEGGNCYFHVYDSYEKARANGNLNVVKVPGTSLAVDASGDSIMSVKNAEGSKCMKAMLKVLKTKDVGQAPAPNPRDQIDQFIGWQGDWKLDPIPDQVHNSISAYSWKNEQGTVECWAWFFQKESQRTAFHNNYNFGEWYLSWKLDFPNSPIYLELWSTLKDSSCFSKMEYEVEEGETEYGQ